MRGTSPRLLTTGDACPPNRTPFFGTNTNTITADVVGTDAKNGTGPRTSKPKRHLEPPIKFALGGANEGINLPPTNETEIVTGVARPFGDVARRSSRDTTPQNIEEHSKAVHQEDA